MNAIVMLKTACRSGDIDEVRRLIDEYNNILVEAPVPAYARMSKQLTLFHPNLGMYDAAAGGHEDIIDLLIESGARYYVGAVVGAGQSGCLHILNKVLDHTVYHVNFFAHHIIKERFAEASVILLLERGLKPSLTLIEWCKDVGYTQAHLLASDMRRQLK